jgi:hypothetical protein
MHLAAGAALRWRDGDPHLGRRLIEDRQRRGHEVATSLGRRVFPHHVIRPPARRYADGTPRLQNLTAALPGAGVASSIYWISSDAGLTMST